MLKKFFKESSKSITSAAIIIGAASLVSRLLGILRDRVLAGEFGASTDLDIYYTAFRVPDLLFNLVVLGALSAGFIPVFSKYLKNKKEAWELVNVVLNVMVLVLLLISALIFILSPWLVKIIAPGFTPYASQLTSDLTRIMLLSPILLGVSGIFGSVLQSLKRFFIFSIAPIFYNVGIIIGALFFVPSLGIHGLAWGVVLGAFFHMIIQALTVVQAGYRYKLSFDLNHQGMRSIFKLMGPRTFSLIIAQLNFFVVTIIGSTLAVGSIAIFNLATNIQSFPLGIFGISFAIAAFPALSELTDKKKQFITTLSLATRQILFFIIPASALFIVLRAQIVRVVLGSGRFNWEDTVLTFQSLGIFSMSLFAQALVLLFARAFFALHDSKTPFYVGLISALSNIILSVMLIDNFGVLGLAMAFSMATVLNFILLTIILHFRLGKLNGGKIAMSSSKIVIATFSLMLTTQALKYPIEQISGTDTSWGIFAQGAISGLGGIMVYFVISYALKSEELTILLNSIKTKLGRRQVIPEEIIEQEKLV